MGRVWDGIMDIARYSTRIICSGNRSGRIEAGVTGRSCVTPAVALAVVAVLLA